MHRLRDQDRWHETGTSLSSNPRVIGSGFFFVLLFLTVPPTLEIQTKNRAWLEGVEVNFGAVGGKGNTIQYNTIQAGRSTLDVKIN